MAPSSSLLHETHLPVIATLWARGMGAREIAAALPGGVSVHAVIGAVGRLGVFDFGGVVQLRCEAMDLVEELFEAPFSFAEPLHPEALMTFLWDAAGRAPSALSTLSGCSAGRVARFCFRLPLVWSVDDPMPERWLEGLEGSLSFVLDMAVVAGVLSASPLRPVRLALAA